MKVIGVTGNIGSGKTAVSNYLKDKNYFIIDADKIGHTILLRKGLAYDEVINFFGDDILDADKNINRKALGKIVFNDKEKLNILTKITHKYIVEIIKSTVQNRKRLNIDKYIIIDAALLIESNLDEICDNVIVVVSNMQTRIERIVKRDATTKENALKKINSQKTNDELVKFANYTIENNSSLNLLYKQIDAVLKNIESR